MKKLYLIGLLYFGISQWGVGQCPSPNEVQVQISDRSAFAQNQGEITFRFESVSGQDLASHRVRLYDTDKKRYIYDENNPAFLNTVPAPIISEQKIAFTELPTGKYELELHSNVCQHQRYKAGSN